MTTNSTADGEEPSTKQEPDADEAALDELPEPPAGLTEADYHGCRWIEGEPTPLRRAMFCGRPTLTGWSWCARHYGIAFGKTGRSARPSPSVGTGAELRKQHSTGPAPLTP